jgi:hypothetical protein
LRGICSKLGTSPGKVKPPAKADPSGVPLKSGLSSVVTLIQIKVAGRFEPMVIFDRKGAQK